MKATLRTLALIALVAVAYYVSGRLGLLLAIPPGYATAVWPASGIAFAAVLLAGNRVLPGVWLGSFLINLPTGVHALDLGIGDVLSRLASGDLELASVFAVPALIGVGALLQAFCGKLLVEWRVTQADVLELETEAIFLLLVGGPLSCILSATFGVGVLHFVGKIDLDGLAVNWATWWVGDSIGVLVFTPLVLMWARRPWRSGAIQKVWVSAVMVSLFSLVVFLFFAVSKRENDRQLDDFSRASEDFAQDIGTRFERAGLALAAIRGLFEGSAQVDRATFDGVALSLTGREPNVRALSWNPVVRSSDAAAFEEAGRKDYGPAFTIHGLADPAPELRTPVRFIAPLADNAPALGLDIASDPNRSNALRVAQDGNAAALSSLVTLVQDPQQLPGVLLVEAVRVPEAIDPGRALRGYAVAALRVADLLGPAVRNLEARHIRVEVTDLEGGAESQVYATALAQEGGGFEREQTIAVAGRQWLVRTRLPVADLLARRSWQTWGFLAAGLLFTGLLGMFLLVLVGRGRRVEMLVERRTAELRMSNSELSRELFKGEKLQTETHRRAGELAAANKELEQFAYIVSHDLQAPLRSIGSFAQLMERKSAEQLDERGREYLSLIREGVSEMQKLIEALLRMSRISRGRLHLDVVQSDQVVARVCESLRADIESSQAEVTREDLPRVYADQDLLSQVFQNLIGNAIKFHRPGVPPRVKVTGQTADSEWRFAVSDNGTGLSPENVERLFQVFRRFHAASLYPGTGIGLAVSRKIVQLHGGRIWAESVEGEGTTFHFSLPLELVQASGA